MLIYNNKKEFIGIDEEDLNSLGFSNLSELMSDFVDFADMFVSKPGLVHNFSHLSWIDFISCADSIQESKAIIDTNSRTFKCLLDVKTVYLSDEPSSKAYLINLVNLKEVTSSELNDISEETFTKPIVQTKPIIDFEIPEPIAQNNIQKNEPQAIDELEIPKPSTQEIKTEEVEIEENEAQVIEDEIIQEEPEEFLDLDTPLDLDFDDDILKPAPSTVKTKKIVTPVEVFDNGYIYDPQIASNELGLPVDLIEEFIEDFIAQADEFKVPLYQSLDNGESDNLKNLSHKLKGVAANLRIEDALESLTIINTSNDDNEIKKNLDLLYKIISKLSIQKTKDENVIDFKELDEPILDSDVPQKINIPELADDDFLNQKDSSIEIDDTINIETISDEETLSLENESIDIDDIQPLSDIKDPRPLFYDKEYTAKEIGIDYENFLELYEDYINEAKDILNSISNAIETNNPSTWKNKALQLNTMCENMRMCDFIEGLDVLMKTDDTILAKEASILLEDTIMKIYNSQG